MLKVIFLNAEVDWVLKQSAVILLVSELITGCSSIIKQVTLRQ